MSEHFRLYSTTFFTNFRFLYFIKLVNTILLELFCADKRIQNLNVYYTEMLKKLVGNTIATYTKAILNLISKSATLLKNFLLQTISFSVY